MTTLTDLIAVPDVIKDSRSLDILSGERSKHWHQSGVQIALVWQCLPLQWDWSKEWRSRTSCSTKCTSSVPGYRYPGEIRRKMPGT